MGKSVKYVAVTMLAACCAGCFLAQGQEQESVAEEARMHGYEAAVSSVRIKARDTVSGCFRSQVSDAVAEDVRQLERDTVASLVAEYEADIRALMDRVVEIGMLDEAGRDSVLLAAGLLEGGVPVNGLISADTSAVELSSAGLLPAGLSVVHASEVGAKPGEAVEAVSETAAVGNKRNSGEGSAENKAIEAGEEIGKSEDILRTRLSLLTELRQEWYGRLRGEYLRQDALTDLIGAPEQMPASAFHPRYLPLDVVEDNLKWAASRPLEVSEILARDRRLILTRMINGSAMPQFLQDLRAQNPAVYSVVAIVMGILGGAGGGFLSGSTMEMLVPRPVVGGQPWFDDMIFLDPNFDPRVYYPSLPVPQYDPENPSHQYKAALRGDNGQEIRAVPIRSAGSSGPTGPPPVQRSRYDLQ